MHRHTAPSLEVPERAPATAAPDVQPFVSVSESYPLREALSVSFNRSRRGAGRTRMGEDPRRNRGRGRSHDHPRVQVGLLR